MVACLTQSLQTNQKTKNSLKEASDGSALWHPTLSENTTKLDSLLQELCINSGLTDCSAVSVCHAQFCQPGTPNLLLLLNWLFAIEINCWCCFISPEMIHKPGRERGNIYTFHWRTIDWDANQEWDPILYIPLHWLPSNSYSGGLKREREREREIENRNNPVRHHHTLAIIVVVLLSIDHKTCIIQTEKMCN